MTNVCVPALHHLYRFLLVGNNRQLCQGLKQVVTLQNQVSLKKKKSKFVPLLVRRRLQNQSY